MSKTDCKIFTFGWFWTKVINRFSRNENSLNLFSVGAVFYLFFVFSFSFSFDFFIEFDVRRLSQCRYEIQFANHNENWKNTFSHRRVTNKTIFDNSNFRFFHFFFFFLFLDFPNRNGNVFAVVVVDSFADINGRDILQWNVKQNPFFPCCCWRNSRTRSFMHSLSCDSSCDDLNQISAEHFDCDFQVRTIKWWCKIHRTQTKSDSYKPVYVIANVYEWIESCLPECMNVCACAICEMVKMKKQNQLELKPL